MLDDQLGEVLEITNRLASKGTSGDFIYRGETRLYEKVSSSLYREQVETASESVEIEVIQEAYLEEARRYTRETDDFEVLTELQHHGGKTNLIDFTTDYLIALFFACDGDHLLDGRVILLERSSEINERIALPRNPVHRVIAQKSIFVRPVEGFVLPDFEIVVPHSLKLPILNYLRDCHGISTETIYNDLHGFIRYRSIHREAFEHFNIGRSHQNNGNYPRAIEYYSEALNLNPQLNDVYNYRGIAYSEIGHFDAAIRDLGYAVEIDPDDASILNNLGLAYHSKRDYERAIHEYTRSIVLELDATTYSNRGNAFRGNGDFDLAIQDFDTAIAMDPEDGRIYNDRANAYFSRGETDLAIRDYTKAVEIDPRDPTTYNNRGNVFRSIGDFDRAIEDYSEAIGLIPDYGDAIYNYGETWLHLSRWEEARVAFLAARDLGVNIESLFHNDYENVDDFEEKNGVKLPEDIAEMLGG